MEKVIQENGNIAFINETESETEVFTMVDMGEYIGHKTRNWYDSAKEQWRLMFYDIYNKSGDKEVHIEALCDDIKGDYTRILEERNGQKRVILLHNNTVVNDYVAGDDTEKEVYYSTDNFLGYPLNKYFDVNPELKEKNKQLKNFVEHGEILQQEIKSKQK